MRPGMRKSVCALLAIVPLSSAMAGDCPALGAIRWDAWFGSRGAPGSAVEVTLGPAQWHNRLPTCSRVLDSGKVEIDCTGEEQMRREMASARAAGLAFWAFVTYPETNPMNLGLQTYLDLDDAGKISFAVISEFEKWLDDASYRPVLKRYVDLVANPAYFKLRDGRPLFFLAFITDRSLEFRFKSRQRFRAVIEEFRNAVQSRGLADPYIVLLDANVERGSGLIRDLGLDGLSAYAVADNRVKAGTYAQLTSLVERFWRQARTAGVRLLPLAMTGWDRRPRVLHPVPWEAGSASPGDPDAYFEQPTKDQLTSHLADAMRAIDQNPPNAASAVLVYAWNEFDEGGWLAPTRGDQRGRLDAVRDAIALACPASPPPR